MKNKISVIIPLYDIENRGYFKQLNDLSDIVDEIILVVPISEDEHIKDIPNTGNVRIVKNSGDSSIPSQLNIGIKEAKNDHIMYIESDDEVNLDYFKVLDDYISKDILVVNDVEHKSDMFLPIIVNIRNGQVLTFQNEYAWAFSASEMVDPGYVSIDTAHTESVFSLSGMCFNKKLKRHGLFKESFKLAFDYEFLLRMLENDANIKVIPFAGYKHNIGGTNTFFSDIITTKTRDEVDFWFELAKSECVYKEDKGYVYDNKD